MLRNRNKREETQKIAAVLFVGRITMHSLLLYLFLSVNFVSLFLCLFLRLSLYLFFLSLFFSIALSATVNENVSPLYLSYLSLPSRIDRNNARLIPFSCQKLKMNKELTPNISYKKKYGKWHVYTWKYGYNTLWVNIHTLIYEICLKWTQKWLLKRIWDFFNFFSSPNLFEVPVKHFF